jgi:post-segregation antitoxin (ccd killing protein)
MASRTLAPVTLPATLDRQLRARARRDGITIAQLVRDALREKLDGKASR